MFVPFLNFNASLYFMFPYTLPIISTLQTAHGSINSFVTTAVNTDEATVESFGNEWTKFNHFSTQDIATAGAEYFDIVTHQMLNATSTVLDVGCGTGRWSMYVANRAKFIEATDPSDAVLSAQKLTQAQCTNIRVTQASADAIPFANNSFDFVFSLGVLHHIPNTQQAIIDAVSKLKPNGWFLVYLYYSLDNRGVGYKALFYASNLLRLIINKLPSALKLIVCDAISIVVYMPLVLLARTLVKIGLTSIAKKLPLYYYIDKNFYIIRNDALDRFGTPLEQRFSKTEIETMLHNAGLTEIMFSSNQPYWHAVGKKTV